MHARELSTAAPAPPSGLQLPPTPWPTIFLGSTISSNRLSSMSPDWSAAVSVHGATSAAEASLGSDVFLWGLDLFNHGYYWEAHEAWEGLWQVVDRGGPSRMLFKGLILLSAAGVKIREGKHAAAVRHAGRAAALLRRLMKVPELAFERTLGMSPAALAEYAEAAAKTHAALQATAPGQPQPVFNFILGSNSHGRPSGQVSRRLL